MTLQWFPFHIDKYLGDTMTLDTEGHGAYLLLMLHYYRTGEPPRDNDRTLAAIARLPMNRWLDRRPDIEAFFEPKDGVWRHTRIETEMLEASSKLARSKAKAEAAAAASHAKRGHKPARSQPQAQLGASLEPVSATSIAPSTASSQLQAELGAQLQASTLTLTLTDKDSLSTEAKSVFEGKEGLDLPGMRQIDPEFQLGTNELATCKFDGATDEEIKAEVLGFIAHHRAGGGFSADWNASWALWWKRWKAHRDKEKAKEAAKAAAKPKAEPRVEVNSAPDWDNFAKMWLKIGRWPATGYGGEPGMVSCRCPPDILTKHGIDPKTGFKIKEPVA